MRSPQNNKFRMVANVYCGLIAAWIAIFACLRLLVCVLFYRRACLVVLDFACLRLLVLAFDSLRLLVLAFLLDLCYCVLNFACCMTLLVFTCCCLRVLACVYDCACTCLLVLTIVLACFFVL